MPLQLSRRVARFNRRINNPVQRQFAWLLPPWAIVVHTGRKSGRVYRTPVDAFRTRSGSTLAIVVLYGERSDWVQNLLAAGGGQIVRGGRTFELSQPRLIDPATAEPGTLSPVAQRFGKLTQLVLVGELSGPIAGSTFGKGPRAA